MRPTSVGTGFGKSCLACALGQAACRHGFITRYFRLGRLLHALALARADGSYAKMLIKPAKTDVLLIDDWGLAPLSDPEHRNLPEVLEDRYRRRAALVTSQRPRRALVRVHWQRDARRRDPRSLGARRAHPHAKAARCPNASRSPTLPRRLNPPNHPLRRFAPTLLTCRSAFRGSAGHLRSDSRVNLIGIRKRAPSHDGGLPRARKFDDVLTAVSTHKIRPASPTLHAAHWPFVRSPQRDSCARTRIAPRRVARLRLFWTRPSERPSCSTDPR